MPLKENNTPTRLCPDTFVPIGTFMTRHVCSQTLLCPGFFCAHMNVHIHDCAHIHNNKNSGHNHIKEAIV